MEHVDAAGSTPTCRHHPVSRRRLLGAAGGVAAGAGLASLVGTAPVAAVTPRATGTVRFAAISDTHISVSDAQSTTWLTQVYASIAAREPDAVLHCGDITDTGLAGEFERYGDTVPGSLKGRIHYTPGNHETRWDPTAKERYHDHFGPAPYSFELGGLHVIGFDPSEILQEPGHFGRSGLDWLRKDLTGLRPGTPALLFQHFPVGNNFYFIDDQPAVLSALAGLPAIKGIIAGHIHREDVTRFNGITQVALNAVKNGAFYYWFEQAAGSDEISVSRVQVAADGSDTETVLNPIPLSGSNGSGLRPDAVHLGRVSSGALPVAITVHPAPTASAEVRPYPREIFGGTSSDPWQPLAGNGTRRTGRVDISDLVPGTQQLELRVRGTDGAWWQQTATYEIARGAADPALLWKLRLPGSVQGGVTVIDPERGVLVTATSEGVVTSFDTAGRRRWSTTIGPVYRRPTVDSAGEMIFLPSADHHLYAVDAATGRLRWSYDAGAPVLSVPTLGFVEGQELITFSAGDRLITLDASSGADRWSVVDRGFSSGQVAIDDGVVFSAAADGYARAHDLESGDQLWAYQMVTGDAHRTALYSGWDTVVAGADGTVVVATVSAATALDASTGMQLWTLPGSAMYAPALIIDEHVLVTTERGVVTLVDLASGAVRWTVDLGLRVFNAGGVLQDGTAWVVTVDGKTIGVRVTDGAVIGALQHSLAYNFARPAVVGNTLVVGDQDGVVRGLRLP